MIPNIVIQAGATLREAMRAIDLNAKGIVLVVASDGRLLSTVTDGDLRRAILRGLNLDITIAEWAELQPEQGNRMPTTAPVGTPPAELVRLMEVADVRQLPLVDGDGCVLDLVALSDLTRDSDAAGLDAVIMAGGFGRRLFPLTNDTPKPMLEVGGRPLMQHIVEQLRDAGIKQVVVTTHYKPEKIVEHFGDGSRFGINMGYVKEAQPLGTAGALALMPPPKTTQIVINGDILTQVNFRSMLAFHKENSAVMTVGVRQYEIQVPFGVVETEGVEVRTLSEKPVLKFFVNAGIYMIEPEAHAAIPRDGKTDMTDLIETLLRNKLRVVSYPVSEYWLDVGRPETYEQAQRDAKNGAFR